LLVLYSIKQFENLLLQQGSHARMQFDILPLQQGISAHSCMQFGILPLRDCITMTAERFDAVLEPAAAAGQCSGLRIIRP
jgi:hypothetical protein